MGRPPKNRTPDEVRAIIARERRAADRLEDAAIEYEVDFDLRRAGDLRAGVLISQSKNKLLKAALAYGRAIVPMGEVVEKF